VGVMPSAVLRGAVLLVALDPAVGSEQGKVRPVVVVSNDGANESASIRGRGVITVIPLTSNVDIVRSYQLRVPAGEGGLPRESKLQVEQLRSIDVSRVVRTIGVLGAERMAQVDEALRIHLGI